MSSMSLSAAVSALQPSIGTGVGISPETALEAWTVIKNFSDHICPYLKTTHRAHLLIAQFFAAGFFFSWICAFYSSRRSEQSWWDRTITLTLHAIPMGIALYGINGYLRHEPHYHYYESLPKAIENLQPGAITSYENSLVSWVKTKHAVEGFSLFFQSQRRLFVYGVLFQLPIAVFAITYSEKRGEGDEFTFARSVLNVMTGFSFALVTVVSVEGWRCGDRLISS